MDNVAKLYEFYRENALLITKIRLAKELYRKQLQGRAGVLITEISQDLTRIEANSKYFNINSFKNGVYNIISSLQSEDYVLCADSLEHFIYDVMIPLQKSLFDELNEYISEIYSNISDNSDNLIALEETPYGYTTLLFHSDKDRYLCSTIDPMAEAYSLAKENFSPEADGYHIWGMGLGYHIYALYQITNGSTDIYVYDNNPVLFDIAHSGKLGKWQDIFNDSRIHLVTDNDMTKFSASLTSGNSKYIIHMPSLHKLTESNPLQAERKNILKKIQITINSFAEQKDDLTINFYKNIKYADGFAEELFDEYKDQNVIIVAAGPSLDKNINVLKKALDSQAHLKVISVGTVFKKLINYGILPDAFCMMDPEKRTYAQIEGMEELTIPLIINTSAYYELSQNYRGKKYIACQKGFDLSEKLGHRLFNTGGSVTTLALDFAIQAEAKKIIMIGCDMAFTGNVTHATNTIQRHNTKDDKVVNVKGFYGDTVPSGLKLAMYREWIENRILSEDAKSIEFINSTEGGAFINGMKHLPLDSVIKEI